MFCHSTPQGVAVPWVRAGGAGGGVLAHEGGRVGVDQELRGARQRPPPVLRARLRRRPRPPDGVLQAG